MFYFSLFALLAGSAIAIQASMNAQLGVLLRSSLLATSVALTSSLLFSVLSVVVLVRQYPSMGMIKAVPVYLWFGSGLLSAFGISMFYYLIPKMGIGAMMSFALSGQIVISVLAGHFGWFDVPLKPLNVIKLIGVCALVIGIVLINKE